MDNAPKNYECAYLLTFTTPEKDVLTYAGKLTTFIEELGGIIRHVEEPKKRKLAYPVKKDGNAYFGWTSFALAPEKIQDLKKKITSLGLLRSMVIHQEELQHAPQFRPHMTRRHKEAPVPREAEKPEEKLDLEQLDKRLDEILGK